MLPKNNLLTYMPEILNTLTFKHAGKSQIITRHYYSKYSANLTDAGAITVLLQ